MLNIVELFLMKAKDLNIQELDLNEFRENFYQLKQNKKYELLFKDYTYDENNICLKFEQELNNLIDSEEIIKFNKYIYIYTIHSHKIENMKLDLLIIRMINDYIKINMKKQKTI